MNYLLTPMCNFYLIMLIKSCNAQVARLNPERFIPGAVLRGAKGLAILTVAKAGMLLTYKFGSGLVVARRSDGSWSAPSAILSAGLGWGAQVYSKLMVFAYDTLLQFLECGQFR